MEAKFVKVQNSIQSIFGLHKVQFMKIDNESYIIRPSYSSMLCSVELRKLITLCDSLDLYFYVRSATTENRLDCIDFVIYSINERR